MSLRSAFVVLIAGVVLVGFSPSASQNQNAPVAETQPIRPSTENRFYWSYDGRPILLVGGSKEDNLFQVSGLEAHLDRLAEAGGNNVRNTVRDIYDTHIREQVHHRW